MADEQRVSQGGVTVAAELLAALDAQRVSQGGVTVVYFIPFRVHAYDVLYEAAVNNDTVHPIGVALQAEVNNDSVHTSNVAME